MLIRCIQDWLGKASWRSERAIPARASCFEPLEPRLLLNADLVGTGPTVPLEVPQAEEAVLVDVPSAAQQQKRSQGAVLTIDLVASGRTEDVDPAASDGPAAGPTLPHLRLADPDSTNLLGQVVYLDFNGATGAVYDGPVSVGPWDVPAFQAPTPWAGQEETIIRLTLADLEQLFAGSGVVFTTLQPAAEQPHSTIYLGGDGLIFSSYGSFLGLAEQVDVGNKDGADEAFVFPDKLAQVSGDMEQYAAALAQLIAHETGHLLGYEHQDSAERAQGLLDQYAADAPVLVDHQATDITQIPESAVTAAKANLHIAYGHTSHGSQLITGMEGLVSFANNDGLGLNLPDNIFSFNAGGTGGALDLRDTPFSGALDLGNPDFTAWATATRNYLNAHPEVNVILWSWCGELHTATEANVNTYLTLMSQLETDYPDVQFVYMTGHLEASGASGNLNVRNEQIRQYCRTNNKILYDFADIESYDPDGLVNYMPLFAEADCTYDADDCGFRCRNWATDWQNSHTENVDWYSCVSAHSEALNANQKAYAAWWLWARLAGWNGGSSGSGNTTPVLTAIGNKSISEGQLLRFTATATDSDIPANTLAFSLLNAPAGASIDASSGVFSWAPSEDQGPGSYNLTVRVTDNGTPNLYDQEAITVAVNEVNQAPTAMGLSNSTVAENQPVGTTVGTLGTTDADNGNTFTYSLVAGTGSTDNSSFAISASTLRTAAIFNFEAKNSYSIRVRTTDAGGLWYEQTFTITVTNVNEAPTAIGFSNNTVAENQPAGTTVGTLSTTDADNGNTFTYSLVAGTGSTDNGSFAISGSTLQTAATFNFEAKNSYSIRVRTTDAGGLWYEQTFTITVTNVNEAPVLAAIGDKIVNEGQLLTFTANATDSDVPANTLTFSLLNAPAGASIDPATGVFSWTPAESQGPSSYDLTVRVTDNGTPNLYDEEAITITVTVNQPNTAPVLAAIGDKSVNEGQLLTCTASATDSDIPANALTFSLLNAPAGANINASTGVFNWTPTEDQSPASYNLTVRVTDNGTPNLYDEEAITITVNEVNAAPVLAAIGNRSVNEGQLLTFTASATDSDIPANSLTFSLLNAPTGASINPSTGVFNWTPAEGQGPGSYNLTVRVTDNGTPNLYDEEAITITVSEANAVPVLDAIGSKSIYEGRLLTFTASATDSDAPPNTLMFSLLNAPAGASIDASSGVFNWTPAEGQGPGDYNLTVRVTDNGTPSFYNEETITITVLQTPGSPVYRFCLEADSSQHFYTIKLAERDKLINNYSGVWTYEGVAFHAFTDSSQPGVAPVYRFWSGSAHFYTMKTTEKDKLLNNYANVWQYEGVAFHAYAEGFQPVGTHAVYRFWSGTRNTHFFTISQTERDKLINNYSDVWTDEGTAWYAYDPETP